MFIDLSEGQTHSICNKRPLKAGMPLCCCCNPHEGCEFTAKSDEISSKLAVPPNAQRTGDSGRILQKKCECHCHFPKQHPCLSTNCLHLLWCDCKDAHTPTESTTNYSIKTLDPDKCPWCLTNRKIVGGKLRQPHALDCKMFSSPTQPDWELKHCKNCNQMTNHQDTTCLKCGLSTPKPDTEGSVSIGSPEKHYIVKNINPDGNTESWEEEFLKKFHLKRPNNILPKRFYTTRPQEIMDFLHQVEEKAFTRGLHQGYEEEAVGCHEHCEKARHSAYSEIMNVVEEIEKQALHDHDNKNCEDFGWNAGVRAFSKATLSMLKEKLQ